MLDPPSALADSNSQIQACSVSQKSVGFLPLASFAEASCKSWKAHLRADGLRRALVSESRRLCRSILRLGTGEPE